MREPKQKRSQRTLEKILAAAVELFESQGVEATGIAEVAKRARSSVGSLYGRFEGKTDLVLAVDRLLWDRVAARWNGSTDAGVTASGTDSMALLGRLHHALALHHEARASIHEFLTREGRESEGLAVLSLLVTEVRDALVGRLATNRSTEHGTGHGIEYGSEVLRFLARIAVDQANAGRGVASAPEGAAEGVADSVAEEIAKLSVGDLPVGEPANSGHLAFVIEATLAELGGRERVAPPEPERTSAPAVDPFDIWA